jgi:hypothetical protein
MFTNPLNTKLKKIIAGVLLAIIIVPIGTYSMLRWVYSKDNISYPAQDHAHFRLKYIFQGQEENFGSPRYQTDYTKDICSGSLTTSPLHFHDNKTDYQHMHWARMTGGQMLKFYGLNYIGGLDAYMGFEMDKLPKVTAVPIHSNSLPAPRPDDKFWVYTGVENPDGSNQWSVQKKEFKDFVNQDFETFFGKESQVRKDNEKYKVSYSTGLFGSISAKAHSGIEHSSLTEEQNHLLEEREKLDAQKLNNQAIQTQSSSSATTKTVEKDPITGEELKSINNFLGDVVIFVQTEEPTMEQVQARFKSMVKLDKSVCGG